MVHDADPITLGLRLWFITTIMSTMTVMLYFIQKESNIPL